MSRRRRIGAFTQTEFSALTSTLDTLHDRMKSLRSRDITMTREECLDTFVKKEHRELLTMAADLATPAPTAYLGKSVKVTYDGLLRGGNEILYREVIFAATLGNPGFMIPDYANRRAEYNAAELLPTGIGLSDKVKKFVTDRFCLDVEFGMVKAFIKWFTTEQLTISQMVYFFPAIINLLSLNAATAKLAEEHSKLKPASFIPRPPGSRDAFGMVEPLIAKAVMVPEEITKKNTSGVMLDVRYPLTEVLFMGWHI